PEGDVDLHPQAVPRRDARDAVVGQGGVTSTRAHLALIALVHDADLQEGKPRAGRAGDRVEAHAQPHADLRLSVPSADLARRLVATVCAPAGEPCGEADEGTDFLAEVREVDVVRGPGGNGGLLHDLVAQEVRVVGNHRQRLLGRDADVDGRGGV